jgi:hypothetical protein
LYLMKCPLTLSVCYFPLGPSGFLATVGHASRRLSLACCACLPVVRRHFRTRTTDQRYGRAARLDKPSRLVMRRQRIPVLSHIPQKSTRQSHLSARTARNPVFSSSGSGARMGSIPIARFTSRCLACPCVVPGRDLAYRPVPTVSTRLQAFP